MKFKTLMLCIIGCCLYINIAFAGICCWGRSRQEEPRTAQLSIIENSNVNPELPNKTYLTNAPILNLIRGTDVDEFSEEELVEAIQNGDMTRIQGLRSHTELNNLLNRYTVEGTGRYPRENVYVLSKSKGLGILSRNTGEDEDFTHVLHHEYIFPNDNDIIAAGQIGRDPNDRPDNDK